MAAAASTGGAVSRADRHRRRGRDGAGRRERAGERASRDAAWQLLRRLPARQRAVLVLRYYEDLSDAQNAAVLGCSASTVRSNAARALAALRAAVPALDKETMP